MQLRARRENRQMGKTDAKRAGSTHRRKALTVGSQELLLVGIDRGRQGVCNWGSRRQSPVVIWLVNAQKMVKSPLGMAMLPTTIIATMRVEGCLREGKPSWVMVNVD